jgi:hypothetical protein
MEVFETGVGITTFVNQSYVYTVAINPACYHSC